MPPVPLKNHKLTIAYNGRAYRGWQRQKEGVSVQETIELALTKLWNRQERMTIHAAGRTDTGVHALGQVAHFEAEPKFKLPADLRNALNANLPTDIRILQVTPVSSKFHSRFSATSKAYHYRLFCREVQDPMELGRCWQMRRQLDLKKIQQVASYFMGEHDFASFASNPGYERETTVRTIHDIRIIKNGCHLTLKFHGSGFLYRMVRNLTGALVRAGDGRLSPEQVKEILQAKYRSAAPPPAPAHGLYLAKVYYS